MEGVSKRTERVNQQLQQELAALLVNGVMDPRVGFVTVTEVRCTPDLRSARVFVSVYGAEQEQQNTIDGLSDAAGFLRRELGHRMRLRHVPELTFMRDNTLEKAARLDDLLNAAQTGAQHVPEREQAELAPVHTARSERAARAEQLAQARAAQAQTPRSRSKRQSSRRNPRARRGRG